MMYWWVDALVAGLIVGALFGFGAGRRWGR